MDIREVLEFVDNAVYDKTGKRLNDLQRGIIEGTLKQQKYSEIAENHRRSEGHVKDVGYELLQMLSEIFGEEVDKNNLKSVLERKGNLNITFGNNNIIEIGYINVCSERTNSAQNENPNQATKFQEPTDKLKIEMLRKLRQFGLKDEQIAEVLGLEFDKFKQMDSQD